MSLNGIGDRIKKSIKGNKPLIIDGEYAIRDIEGRLYFELDFLKKYGDIVRYILRDLLWEEIRRRKNEEDK